MAQELEPCPMCARRIGHFENALQEDAFIRKILPDAWKNGYDIAGFYDENSELYIVWPRELKEELWNLPVSTGAPFEIDFHKKAHEVEIFWIVFYSPGLDPIAQAFTKNKKPTHE